MVAVRGSEQNFHHQRECKRQGSRSYMSKSWKQRPDTDFEKVKMGKLIEMIRLYCLNQDLNLVTCIWPKKYPITSTIC